MVNPLFFIPSAIALAVNLGLGLYVLSKNPKNSTNRLFAFISVTLALWIVSDALMRAAPGPGEAFFWFKAFLLDFGIMSVAIIHFTFLFPRRIPYDLWFLHPRGEPTIVVPPRLAIPGMYSAPLLFGAVLFANLFPGEAYMRSMDLYCHAGGGSLVKAAGPPGSLCGPYDPWGYLPNYEPISPIILAGFAILVLFYYRGGYNCYRAYRETDSEVVKKQVVLMLIGAVLMLNATGLFSSILPYMGIVTPLYGAWPTMFVALFSGYSVLRYKLLLQPATEAPRLQKTRYEVSPGKCYLVKEPRMERSIEVFTNLVFQGVPGLCITRTLPSELRRQTGLEKTPMLWLSRRPAGDDPSLSGLHDLYVTIEDFVKRSPGSIVLLDGLAYLIQNSGFTPVLKFIQDLREVVTLHRSRLLLPLDTRTLEPREMALLEGETEPLPF
ncbi:MAG: DUF835 domain-containing protein [Euryarchaeota archaeon]|nr:DUF835 domain-containing protein [Euryarchaeota archaeon]